MILDIGTPTHGVTLEAQPAEITLTVFSPDIHYIHLLRADAAKLRDALTRLLDEPADTMVESVPT